MAPLHSRIQEPDIDRYPFKTRDSHEVMGWGDKLGDRPWVLGTLFKHLIITNISIS